MSLRLHVDTTMVVHGEDQARAGSVRLSQTIDDMTLPSPGASPLSPMSPRPYTFTSIMNVCWVCPSCIERRKNRKRRQERCNGPTSPTKSNAGKCASCGLPAECVSICRVCSQKQKNLTSDVNYSDFLNGHRSHPLSSAINGVTPVDTEEDSTQHMFVEAFLHNNRLDHLVQVMGYHPQYLDCFLRTQHHLMRGDGPLPYDFRHYIAIMAAGRHQCSYLINIQSTEFLLQGGDERWLKGLQYAPKKLQDLCELNKLMAHRPWFINKTHIEALTKSSDNSNNWSVSELMHAIVLLAHFHSLASFVYGCGINPEIDHEDGHTFRPPSLSDNSTSTEDLKALSSSGGGGSGISTTPNSNTVVEAVGVGALIDRMKRLHQEAAPEAMTQEELVKRFERVGALNAELPEGSRQLSPNANILRFVEDPDFTYQAFVKRGAEAELPSFRAQDYSWDDHGFSLANRLYTDIGNLLDDKFKMAANLTYYTMGDTKNVDTSSFRAAVHYYIHCIFGIRHDDCDYNAVHQLLERSLKAYIKTATCFPERVIKRDYDSFMREFKHSEKVHVNIMLLEARMQAELLYALRAFNQHLT